MRGLALVAALVSFGCETEPYCLNCFDGSLGDGGGRDASADGASRDAAIDRDAADAAGADGCLEVELCNELDDDCDGLIDEDFDLGTNPVHCGACDRRCNPPHAFPRCEDGICTRGDCDFGFYDIDMDPSNGCEYRCAGTETDDHICDLRDDDCDGMLDEDVDLDGDPLNCGRCGAVCNAPHSEAACDMGACTLASCDTGFFDIDGRADNGCEYACTAAVPPGEVCNSRDDDCDGTIDEGNPGGGAACGGPTTVGACAIGAMTCTGGSITCVGGTTPTLELCNMIDDDCDGSTDEDFALMTDVSNCGRCGNRCMLPNAVDSCVGGVCTVAACDSGFVDLDPGVPGCEYMCSPSGGEICNALDDDCNGMADDGLTPPMGFCNPNGVCSGTTAVCSGAAGWTCTYGPTYETPETSCDGLDNDCDGFPDEGYLEVGTACSNGIGACRTTGMFVCNAAGDGVTCTAPPAGMPADEECNDIDDDCDGVVDERDPDDAGTPWRDGIAIATVVVDRSGGGTVRIMQYEASRPDATSTEAGYASTLACSRADVVPWTTVTWTEARDACCALNPTGGCPATGAPGWRLCDAADWQSACEGPSGTCDWSYATMCGVSQPRVCNGDEHDCDPATPGDQDCLYSTGSPTFPLCNTGWGAAGSVYDLSGNAKEWTGTEVSPSVYAIRGGAYVNLEPGRACDFDFAAAAPGFSHPDTGFRCCQY